MCPYKGQKYSNIFPLILVKLCVSFGTKNTKTLQFYKYLKTVSINVLLFWLQSPVNADTGSAQDETSSSGNKEDEDDDDDESDDKIDTHTHDPERLKAFNVSKMLN